MDTTTTIALLQSPTQHSIIVGYVVVVDMCDYCCPTCIQHHKSSIVATNSVNTDLLTSTIVSTTFIDICVIIDSNAVKVC